MKRQRVLLPLAALSLWCGAAVTCSPRTMEPLHAANPPPASSSDASVLTEEADAAVGATADADVADAAPEPVVPPSLADSINLFARDLHGVLAKQKGNLFYSPLSLHIALSMTFAGARGITADEMAKVLHLDSGAANPHADYSKLIVQLSSEPKAGAPEVRMANRLWVDKQIELVPAFQRLMQSQYRAPVEKLDFEHEPEPSRAVINSWVEQQTKQRIKELLPKKSIDARTAVVLSTAVYFKGAWAAPFPKEATRNAPFFVDGTRSRPVPTMQAEVKGARYADLPDASVVELPYSRAQGPPLAMLIVLPKQRIGIGKLESRFGREGLQPFVQGLRAGRFVLFLPKFSVAIHLRMNQELEGLGMPSAFDEERANFSGMVAGVRVKISSVHHEAFVRTDEEGTEAGAASGVVMTKIISESGSLPVVKVDHPFLLLIRDVSSGVILFGGRVMQPTM